MKGNFHEQKMDQAKQPIVLGSVTEGHSLPRQLPATCCMLRSQIKLTSYDFSDLNITGKFDNRPGTGRFLRIFFCVVTYRTGAARRLYMKTSADARPGTVRRRTVPGRRCKTSTGHRTMPGRFYTMFSYTDAGRRPYDM